MSYVIHSGSSCGRVRVMVEVRVRVSVRVRVGVRVRVRVGVRVSPVDRSFERPAFRVGV